MHDTNSCTCERYSRPETYSNQKVDNCLTVLMVHEGNCSLMEDTSNHQSSEAFICFAPEFH